MFESCRDRHFNLLIQGLASLTRVRDLAAEDARVLLCKSRPLQSEGAGNAGCPMHPQPGVRILVVKYAHQCSQRKHRKHPASPTQWFYGLLRALPGDHRFVDPVIRATRWRLANLTPASGRQNHTASPSATAKRSSHAPSRPSHPAPRTWRSRVAPLLGRDRGINNAVSTLSSSKISVNRK
jgi:hypothetical protein